jgi:hypothetical protein
MRAKIFLEGPFNNGENNMLRNLNEIVPKSSPYSQAPVTTNFIPPIVVDWVLVELRDKKDSSVVVASKSAFLTFDSKIVGLDGESPVRFPLPEDRYYIVIKHRNHLPVMSANPVPLTSN